MVSRRNEDVAAASLLSIRGVNSEEPKQHDMVASINFEASFLQQKELLSSSHDLVCLKKRFIEFS